MIQMTLPNSEIFSHLSRGHKLAKKNQNLIFQLLEKSLSSNRVTEVRDLYRKLNLPQNVAYDFFSYINRNGGDSTMTFQWVSILRDAGIDIGLVFFQFFSQKKEKKKGGK